MFNVKITIEQVANILFLVAFVPYIIAILRGKVKPNRITWWVCTTAGFILGAIYCSSGGNHTIWTPARYLIGPFITALLSLKYGRGGWTHLRKLYLCIRIKLCCSGRSASYSSQFSISEKTHPKKTH